MNLATWVKNYYSIHAGMLSSVFIYVLIVTDKAKQCIDAYFGL